MSEANVALVKSLYEAVGRQDRAAIFAVVDPGILIRQTELLPWGGQYQGIEGLQAFFGKLFANVESQLATEQFLDAGNDVVMIGRTSGRTKANGMHFDITAIHVWAVREGKIVGFYPYIDTPEMLKVLAA